MLRYRLNARRLAEVILLAAPAAMVFPAVAQQPSPKQIATIRQACRSDFISHCSGVQPGGREALACLQNNAAQLSATCRSAISAAVPNRQPPQPVTAAPQPQQAQGPEQDQLAAVRRACTLDDFVSHCSWIAPNSPELLLCLRANASQLSASCQSVLATSAAAAPPAPKAAPSVAAPAAPTDTSPAVPAAAATPPPAADVPPVAAAAPRATARQPSAKQISAIRAACRSDFISRCSGVQPGGRAALECLERNKAEVSKACQGALASLGGLATGTEAAPGAPSAADAPASPPPELFTLRRLRSRQELPILRTCAGDVRSVCAGIPPGGGRIIACLARNGSQLSQQCRDALAELRN